MNDIDDILSGLNMSSSAETSRHEEPLPSNGTHTLSDADISDILEDNGIEEAVFDGEGHEEEMESNSYNENQGEGNDISVEQEDNALAEMEPEEVGEEFPEYPSNLAGATAEVDIGLAPSIIEETPTTPQEEEKAKIPLNSPTLLIDTTTARFSGTEWYNEIQKARIILGGCGGIGSNVAFQLARMIPANITIYDDDTVETLNMAGQLFSYKDIGKSKVTAIADMILQYTSMKQVSALKQMFTESTEPGNIMICGFDNMRARKIFFNSWYRHIKGKSMKERAKCLLIDGRLSIDTLQVLCIRGDDEYNINRYQCEFLFSDSQADETICSMKQTTYLACMIGSLIVNLFTNFVAGTLDPVIPYDLPFFTEYNAQSMIFKTEN